ncbi:neprilysin-1-like isoform X2 [Oppia nitens]|uniref:neprilysin-1-like isoform X2 n=1 Tax=Oppia nitens TaxID=1686743 RepID=UPI0023DC54FE|nr:neprilysin-1-like isoform X2 [Oppia nitens]
MSKMMNVLVAAIRDKRNGSKRDSGFSMRSQYPQYVLYDSDGDEVECNLSNMKMSYGSNSKTALTDVIIRPRGRGFWSNRTPMERFMIFLITTLFMVTVGLVLTATYITYNRDINVTINVNQTSHSDIDIISTGSPDVIFSNQSIQTVSNRPENAVSDSSESSIATQSTSDTSVVINQTMANTVHTNEMDDQSVIETQNTSNVTSDNAVNTSETLVDNKLSSISINICNTEACKKAGQIIRDSLNTTIDPCDDFYEFACGGWETTHTIPADKSRYGSFDAVDEELKKSIKEYLSKKTTKSDSKAVIYASDFYKACIDEATINSRGVTPLLDALNSVGGWPIIGQSSVYKNSDYDWTESFAKQMVNFGVAAIYSVSVQPDSNDTLVNRVYYDSGVFGLGRNQLANTSAYTDIVNAYKKYILESALLLGGKNDSQTQQDIEDILAFESKLAILSLPPEKKRDSSIWYNRMSFNAFNDLTTQKIDWLSITNKIYEKLNSTIRVQNDELVIIQDIDYYKGVSELFEKTPVRVIANYFGWMTVMNLGSYTTKQFRDIVFTFDKVVSGVEKETELWQTCTNSLSSSLQYAVSRLYVDKKFTQKDKEEAALMINDIKESYNQLIAESDWLDESTKNKSLIKLNAIKQNIGYPDWLLNNDDLDNYYKLTQSVDPKKSFESILYLQYVSVNREFKSIREKVNLTLSWPMPPAIVNAAYEPTQNSITIPAGILTLPFFDSQRPAYLNYGAIGLVVGHEMTHGFDDEGSQFDPNGNLINWWTQEIRKRFEQKADCFINEYSSIYVPEVDMHLNGKNTVGENIADNGGMRESYRAYQIYIQKHGEPPRLPYVSDYTPEQLYFMSHANVWCSLWRPEALKTQIQYNPHSPGKYRVNVPVSNFKAFSDAYKCSPNSRMNRKDKCILW